MKGRRPFTPGQHEKLSKGVKNLSNMTCYSKDSGHEVEGHSQPGGPAFITSFRWVKEHEIGCQANNVRWLVGISSIHQFTESLKL